MQDAETRLPLQLGTASAALIVLIEAFYAIALVLGLAALEAPTDPIADPYFSVMEVLIMALMPTMILFSVAMHASCAEDKKTFALASVIFVAILSAITTSVHASILFLSRDPAFSGMNHVFSFQWPSVVYVLDVLAWDVFFALFAACLALTLKRDGIERSARWLLFLSAALAFAGSVGAVTGDMRIRNIGIIGYVPVFTIATGLIGVRMLQRMRSPS